MNLKMRALLEARRLFGRHMSPSSRTFRAAPTAACAIAIMVFFCPDLSAVISPAPVRDSIVKSALSLVGTPYRYGGSSTKGFDCCGFVMYVYALNHISVPRTSREQFSSAKPIDLDDIQKGDLLFYRINSKAISHVGIYIGDGQFVHSSVPGSYVRVERIDQEYWEKYFAGAATFLQ